MALHYNLVGLLHTNAHKFNPMKNYQNLGSISSNFNKQDLFNQVNSHIQILEEQEQSFYNLIFPGFSGTYKDFILQMRGIIAEEDKEIFNKFSSFDKNISLQKSIMDELRVSVDEKGFATDVMSQNILGKVGRDKKKLRKVPGRFVSEGEVISATKMREKFHFTEEDFNQIMKIEIKFVGATSKKSTKTGALIDLRPIINEALKQTNDAEVIPLLVDGIYERLQIEKRNLSRKANYEVPQKPLILSYLKGPIKQKIQECLSLEGSTNQDEVDFAYLWGFEQGRQRRAFDETKQYQKERIYNLLLNMSKGCSQRFLNALNNVWLSNYEYKFENMNFSDSSIPGFLGEFAGAVLFEYLTLGNGKQMGISPTIVGNKKYENWASEEMRSDIRIGEFGIQAKNWKESSLSNFNINIKLHPLQILHRLSGLLNASLTEELETFFANLAFNNESVNEYNSNPSPIIKLLSAFFPYIANFISADQSADLGTDFLDTSPFWLLGGKALVPASLILKDMIELLGEEFEAMSHGKEISSMILDISSNPRYQETEWKEGEKYINNPFWIMEPRKHKKFNYEIANWTPTSENKPEFDRMLKSNRVTTHIRFKPLRLKILQEKLLSELSFI